jgi:hypothetical protein
MKIDVLPEYSHDLKQLLKKLPSLTEDVARACKVIEAPKNRDRSSPPSHLGKPQTPNPKPESETRICVICAICG